MSLGPSPVYYRLLIQYQGTRYLGWQIQPTGMTVQGELNKALETIFKSTNIKTIGSGRTDTGVHSLCHVVKVEAPFSIPFEALQKGLNSLLPDDIEVLQVSQSTADFLPTNHAKDKEYFYLFSNLPHGAVMMKNMMSNVTFDLDLELMQKACECFVGTHDFSAFRTVGTEVASPVRTIYSCTIEYVPQSMLYGIVPPHYKVTIVGNGFLKQMVRLIVGTLWEVGRGKLDLQQIRDELKMPSGKRIAPVAPPDGLYKSAVTY